MVPPGELLLVVLRAEGDVVRLALVDFDGRPVFQTGPRIVNYDASPALRGALGAQLLRGLFV